MPAPTTTFGVGDYGGYNNWYSYGNNTMYTNWYSSPFSTGTMGRVTALGDRWDGWTSGTTGHNGLYNSGSPFGRVAVTADFGVGTGSGSSETMHNAATSANFWTASTTYYLGFARVAADSHTVGFQTGFGSGSSGKSAGDGDLSGGSAAGGSLPCYGTIVNTAVYVRRSGAWVQTFAYVRRSGSWTGPAVVNVWRSGAWSISNLLRDHHIPARGLPVIVDVGEGPERGWLVEDGEMGWFGSIDPTLYAKDFDWRVPGHYVNELRPPNYRYNSAEPQQWVEMRQFAADKAQRLITQGNFKEAEIWKSLTGPESKINMTPAELTRIVSTRLSRELWSPPLTRSRPSIISLAEAASDFSVLTPDSSLSTLTSGSHSIRKKVLGVPSVIGRSSNVVSPDLAAPLRRLR
jgi:hypothetical protein